MADRAPPENQRLRALFEMARPHVDRPATPAEMDRDWRKLWEQQQAKRPAKKMRNLGFTLGILVVGTALAFGINQRGHKQSAVSQSDTHRDQINRSDNTTDVTATSQGLHDEATYCPARYVDPLQIIALTPDTHSATPQPWRAWLETVPASRLLQAPGVTLGDHPIDAATAQKISAAGFRYATVEIAWDHVEAEDDGRMKARQRGQHFSTLTALRTAGIRPTILLTAVTGASPLEKSVALARPAFAGARDIWIDPASMARVVPGRTRIRESASTIIVAMTSDGHATLSRPLSRDLQAHVAYTTLVTRYAPFRRPRTSDGQPDPVFAETVEGWRRYVRTVLEFVRRTVGDDGFDLEVWNIYRGAGDFFDVERYYDPAPADLGAGGPEAAAAAVVAATVEVVQGAGLPQVRIANGFANRAWVSGGVAKLDGVDGISAIGRHVDAHPLRRADGETIVQFPEIGLTTMGDQPLFRDLSPVRTSGMDPALATGQSIWVTSLSLGTRLRPDIPREHVGRFKTVMALRGLAAYAHKGAERVMLYQHDSYEAITGDTDETGKAMRGAMARFLAPFRNPSGEEQPDPKALNVSLESFALCPQRRDTPTGEGDAGLGYGHLFAFFPFQVSNHRVAAVVYVMSRNPVRGIIDSNVFPPVQFGLRVSGLPPGTQLSLIDPINPQPLPATTVTGTDLPGSLKRIDLEVTDSPRILIMDLPK